MFYHLLIPLVLQRSALAPVYSAKQFLTDVEGESLETFVLTGVEGYDPLKYRVANAAAAGYDAIFATLINTATAELGLEVHNYCTPARTFDDHERGQMWFRCMWRC